MFGGNVLIEAVGVVEESSFHGSATVRVIDTRIMFIDLTFDSAMVVLDENPIHAT